jgi:hypothetical protein
MAPTSTPRGDPPQHHRNPVPPTFAALLVLADVPSLTGGIDQLLLAAWEVLLAFALDVALASAMTRHRARQRTKPPGGRRHR